MRDLKGVFRENIIRMVFYYENLLLRGKRVNF